MTTMVAAIHFKICSRFNKVKHQFKKNFSLLNLCVCVFLWEKATTFKKHAFFLKINVFLKLLKRELSKFRCLTSFINPTNETNVQRIILFSQNLFNIGFIVTIYYM